MDIKLIDRAFLDLEADLQGHIHATFRAYNESERGKRVMFGFRPMELK